MENEEDDIYELNPEDELGSSGKKRSGMVVKTSGFSEASFDGPARDDSPAFKSKEDRLLEMKKQINHAAESLAKRSQELEERETNLKDLEAPTKKRARELDRKEEECQELLDGLQDREDALAQEREEFTLKTESFEDREATMLQREKVLEAEHGRIEELRFSFETERQELHGKAEEVEKREKYLKLSQRDLKRLDDKVKESKSELKEKNAQLLGEKEKLIAQRENLIAEKNGIENENRRLRKEKEELEQEKKEHQRERQLFLKKIDILKKREAKLKAREKEIETTLHKMKSGEDRESQLLQEMEDKEEKLRSENACVERLKSELEVEQDALGQAKTQLELAQKHIQEQEEALKGRSKQLEEEFQQRFFQMEKEGSAPSAGMPELEPFPAPEPFTARGPTVDVSSILDELKADDDEVPAPEPEIPAYTPEPAAGMSDLDDIDSFLEQEREDDDEEDDSELLEDDEDELVEDTDELLDLDDLEEEPEEKEQPQPLPSLPQSPPSGKDIKDDEFAGFDSSSDIMAARNLSPEEQDKKIQQYRNYITHFKENGYDVIKVSRAFQQNDFNLIKEKMLDFMEKVQKMKEVEKELGALESEINSNNITGFDETLHVIRTKLKAPEALARVQKTMESLKKKVDTEKGKRLAAKMKEFDKVKDMYDALEARYSLEDYAEELYDIRSQLSNPQLLDLKDISKLSTTIKKLEHDITDREQKKRQGRLQETIELEIKSFKEKGYRVKALEDALRKDIKDAEKLYLDYLTNIDRLDEMRREMDNLNTAGFEKESEEIRDMMSSPMKVDHIEDAIHSLKRKIRVKRIKSMDLTLKEKYQDDNKKGKKTGSMNLDSGGAKSETPPPSTSPLERPVSTRTEPLQPVIPNSEKPKVKVCPNCKTGRIVIPPKIRPIRVNCQTCGKEFLITGDPVPAKAEPKKTTGTVDAFDGQQFDEEKGGAPAQGKLGPAAIAQAVQKGICPSCDAALIKGSDFCGFCGFRIK